MQQPINAFNKLLFLGLFIVFNYYEMKQSLFQVKNQLFSVLLLLMMDQKLPRSKRFWSQKFSVPMLITEMSKSRKLYAKMKVNQ